MTCNRCSVFATVGHLNIYSSEITLFGSRHLPGESAYSFCDIERARLTDLEVDQ